MIAPRWRKVLRDLWINRVRTLLIILAIAVGVFALGILAATSSALSTELPHQYAQIVPAQIIFTTSLFDDDLADAVKSVAGVKLAEGRRNLAVRMLRDAALDDWRDITIYQIADYENMQTQKILHVSGDWPPEKGTLLMERGSLTYLGLHEGDQITIKTPQGRIRTMPVSGVAHDLYDMPALIEGTVYAFASEDTIDWLGQEPGYNELYVLVDGDSSDRQGMRTITEEVTDYLEGAGLTVYTTFRPRTGSYPMDYIANTVLLLLGLLGGLIWLLGGFLVVNTITALIAQQTRQIGVLKAIGGRKSQIAVIYLGMVFILGLIGTLVAIPFSFLGARELVAFISEQFNSPIRLETFPVQVILIQVLIGIVTPMLVALPPVLSGVNKPAAEALNEYGRNRVWSGVRLVDRLLSGIKNLTRPVLLAFRNPFRKGTRLVFSLVMLTLAGGSFITVMNLNTSLNQTVEAMIGFWRYDFWVDLNRPYLTERLSQEALTIPGVTEVEGWCFEMTRRIRPDGSESNPIFLFAVPPASTMVAPHLLEGRWLQPGDENTLVIGAGLKEVEPDIKVGSEIIMKVNGDEEKFRVVGLIEAMGNQTVGYLVYASYPYYTRIAHKVNRADMAVMRTSATTDNEKIRIGAEVEKVFDKAGIEITSVLHMSSERMEINSAFNIVITLLLIMVFLLAFVGGLGLMGTMSLNVIDRAREIGVIRAFGGSNRSVFRIVILEGMITGGISWLFSLVLALPLTSFFCDAIGISLVSSRLSYRYSFVGALLWLVLVILLSGLSSILPAWNAVRLTVREVLTFE